MSLPASVAVLGAGPSQEVSLSRLHNPNPCPIQIMWGGHKEVIPPLGESRNLFPSEVADKIILQADQSYGGFWVVLMPPPRERKARMDAALPYSRLRGNPIAPKEPVWHIVPEEQYNHDPQLGDASEEQPYEPLRAEQVATGMVIGGEVDSLKSEIERLRAENDAYKAAAPTEPVATAPTAALDEAQAEIDRLTAELNALRAGPTGQTAGGTVAELVPDFDVDAADRAALLAQAVELGLDVNTSTSTANLRVQIARKMAGG